MDREGFVLVVGCCSNVMVTVARQPHVDLDIGVNCIDLILEPTLVLLLGISP